MHVSQKPVAAFRDGFDEPWRARLSTTENLELWAVYFDVPLADGVFRLDAPDPGNCALQILTGGLGGPARGDGGEQGRDHG